MKINKCSECVHLKINNSVFPVVEFCSVHSYFELFQIKDSENLCCNYFLKSGSGCIGLSLVPQVKNLL